VAGSPTKVPPDSIGPFFQDLDCRHALPSQRDTLPVQHRDWSTGVGTPPTHAEHFAGRGTPENELLKLARRPLTASSTTERPKIAIEVFDAVFRAFHECPVHVQVVFGIGNRGHAGWAIVSLLGVIRTGQAMPGVVAGI